MFGKIVDTSKCYFDIHNISGFIEEKNVFYRIIFIQRYKER